MFSSPQKKAPTEQGLTFIETGLICPECGRKSLAKVRGDCPMRDGITARNLVYYHCFQCVANLFDRAAMREIRRQQSEQAKERLGPFAEAPWQCPLCGAQTLDWLQGDCVLLDGTVIRDLSRLHCATCGEDLFDPAAMDEIRRQREQMRTKA